MQSRKKQKVKKKLEDAFHTMFSRYGSLDWWPGETRLEIIVGAVLTQNTNWKNVELAIQNLRSSGLLHLQQLLSIEVEKLEELVRPAGYYRLKTKRLRNLLRFISEEFGDIDSMFSGSQDSRGLQQLRRKLLGVNGIGPETADSILLYAGEKPSFVIDAYTHRVAKRHGWIETAADYETLKAFFEDHLAPNVGLYNEYHALLVNVGKDHCKPTPRCENCPLQDLLPKSGPITWPAPK